MKCPGCQSEFELILFDYLRMPWEPHRCPACLVRFRFQRPLRIAVALYLVLVVLAVVPAFLIGWCAGNWPLAVGALVLYAGAFVLPLQMWLDGRWGRPMAIPPDAAAGNGPHSSMADGLFSVGGVCDTPVARFAAIILSLPSWFLAAGVVICWHYGLPWPDGLPPGICSLACTGLSLASLTLFLLPMGERPLTTRSTMGMIGTALPLLLASLSVIIPVTIWIGAWLNNSLWALLTGDRW